MKFPKVFVRIIREADRAAGFLGGHFCITNVHNDHWTYREQIALFWTANHIPLGTMPPHHGLPQVVTGCPRFMSPGLYPVRSMIFPKAVARVFCRATPYRLDLLPGTSVHP